MTTETARAPRDPGTRALVRAALVSAAVGLMLTLVAALGRGSAAAWGALVGTLLVVAVFAFGSFSVNLVATVLPSAALLVALLTYTLQVVVMGLVFVGLSGSGLLDGDLDRRWLAGSVIAGTVAWLAVQIGVATTRRIPAYDLPERDLARLGIRRGEGSAR
ncbi:hypothetical protein GCM10027062_05660 [Nocardioides hungaricus]